MNSLFRVALHSLGLVILGTCGLQAAKATPDLLPSQRRQTTVVIAERLARVTPPPAVATNLISPFNPKDFNKSEAPETSKTPADQSAPVQAQPAAPLGDRQILEVLAAQLSPTGTIQIGGSPRLVMGSKRFEVGTRFTVTYNNEDYELELVSIDRTTFTLRYRGIEITRPIKSVR